MKLVELKYKPNRLVIMNGAITHRHLISQMQNIHYKEKWFFLTELVWYSWRQSNSLG